MRTTSTRTQTPLTALLTTTVALLVRYPALAQPASTSQPALETEVESFTPDFFPILPWNPLHGWRGPDVQRAHGLASIADCGFTIAGFVQDRDLLECEQLGLRAIIAPPAGDAPWAGPWRSLTDEQIEARVKTMIAAGGTSKAVIGYFIMDEPGTRDFPALSKAVAAVRKHAPGKLAYINLFPGYATIGAPDTSQLGAASFTEYLERFVREVKPQFLSYDNYMVQFSDDLQNAARAVSYFNDLLEVRRVAMKNGLPFWNIVSSNQIRPETTVPSPANLAFQAFTTMAAGGRGVSWYTYYASSGPGRGYAYAPVDHDGHKTDTWVYLQMVNQQLKAIGPLMNQLTSTGVFFTAPPPLASLPLLPGKIIKDLQSRASLRGSTDARPPLMLGEFSSSDGRDHAMIVNLSLAHSANVTMKTQRDYSSREIASSADGQWRPLDDSKGLWLTPGQGVLLRFR